MSRERLTSRVAGEGKGNDSYDMNDTGHAKNQPSDEEYVIGTPETFGEGVAKKNWKNPEDRNEMNVADLHDKLAATEAVASVKALEKKAVKCMVASQRMLPGATDDLIVKQAIDLMNLPEEAINATLARQETLANNMKLAAEGKKPETCEEKEEKEEKEAAKKIIDEKKAKLEAMKKEAAILEKEITAGQNDPHAFYGKGQKVKDVEAAKVEKKEEEEEKKDVEAAKVEKKEEEEEKKDVEAAKVEKKEEDDGETSKEASLLDTIFSDVIASDTKKGATKLSGIVKKEASTDSRDALSKLWNSAPDVSGMFR